MPTKRDSSAARLQPDAPRYPMWLRRTTERLMDRVPFVEKEMPVVRRLVQPGWVCLDIGAAGGTYTHLLSRAVGPAGQVHAIEPRAGAMRNLARLSRWLTWDNVTLHQLALSASNGHAELVVPRWVRTEAHLAPPGPATSGAQQVGTLSLDELVDQHGMSRLDLIACDVEGAELQVLKGADRSVARFRPIVVCEIEQRHLRRYDTDPQEVTDWFRDRSYQPYRVHAGQLIAVSAVTTDDNDYVLWPAERPIDARQQAPTRERSAYRRVEAPRDAAGVGATMASSTTTSGSASDSRSTGT